MKLTNLVIRLLIVFLLTFCIDGLYGQTETQDFGFEPEVGQAGKDVIWVPTPDELVNKMMEIAKVSSDDMVIDLGSGDGRTVIAAAKLGAQALGIEYDINMIELSKKNAKDAGVSEKAKFIKADLFEYDLSEATVITMFLLPEINLTLRPQLLKLKPGTRIVSNTFTMGEWKPDNKVTIDGNYESDYDEMYEDNWNSWTTALLWIVPAKVDGIWQFRDGKITIRQEFQMINGTYKTGNKTTDIKDGRLKGNSITFSIDGEKYSGHINGDKTITGTVNSGTTNKNWVATYSGI
ncbi:class I SAM-dependent methyltransferase [Draconibacterium sp.]|nr:class I SAM-dependent methyltransferase [Draconibacterium sp.]